MDFVEEMTKTERVMAAVNGEEVDRIPVCFWHHFRPEGSGRRLADATFDFFDSTFDLDLLKIMPDIPYPFPRRSIRKPEEWRLIEPIDAERSHYFHQRAQAIQLLRDMVGFDTPIVMTVFSPLAEAMYFAENRETFLEHATKNPTLIHEALATIAGNLRTHIQDCIDAGADGVYFALQG
ncbi:uroporphyrinogen decarboxylase family protein, partial [Nitrolancea hollandica]|uniref:uroporphyrinogen decarboxylase family protein n=1 Tax=Nitrolancea hollandica TaxID=1206749 RepID=UPI00058CDBB9